MDSFYVILFYYKLGLRELGHAVKDGVVFDTIKVTANGNPDSVLHRAEEKKINLRQFSNGEVSW